MAGGLLLRKNLGWLEGSREIEAFGDDENIAKLRRAESEHSGSGQHDSATTAAPVNQFQLQYKRRETLTLMLED